VKKKSDPDATSRPIPEKMAYHSGQLTAKALETPGEVARTKMHALSTASRAFRGTITGSLRRATTRTLKVTAKDMKEENIPSNTSTESSLAQIVLKLQATTTSPRQAPTG